jgi:hypothetical protein
MASMPSEPFCTVREFPASLCDQHLLPSAKIDTQRGYKNKSGRRQKAKRPSTHLRFSSDHRSAICGATVRHRRTNLYCDATKHGHALGQIKRPASCRARPHRISYAASLLLRCSHSLGYQCLPSVAWPRPSRSSLPLKWAASTRFAGSAFSPRFGIGPL